MTRASPLPPTNQIIPNPRCIVGYGATRLQPEFIRAHLKMPMSNSARRYTIHCNGEQYCVLFKQRLPFQPRHVAITAVAVAIQSP